MTTSYPDQWKLLSGRIRGLTKAGHLHAQYLAVNSSDTYGRAKHLREQSEHVLKELKSFRDRFQDSLPLAAITSIALFETKTSVLITDTTGTQEALQHRVWAALVLLAAFETELSFILGDHQETIHTLSERAFSHLQRSIVADPAFQEKWRKAFNTGEVACEKLGAVHLLLHGIWAFKVDAAGARTDLVFQEPVRDVTTTQRYADGLVLTEWKKAGPSDDPGKRFEEARLQAKRYAQGALAGIELVGYRFAVVVSQQQVEVPEDWREGEVVYRHINIAVEPRLPSQG